MNKSIVERLLALGDPKYLQPSGVSEAEVRENQREVWCEYHKTYHPAYIDGAGWYHSRCGFGSAEAAGAGLRLKSSSTIQRQQEQHLSNDEKIERLLRIGDVKMLGLA